MMMGMHRKTVQKYLKKLKIEVPYEPALHFWVYTQKNRKQDLKEITGTHVHSSTVHNSHEVDNANVHSQIYAQTKCGMYIEQNAIQPQEKENPSYAMTQMKLEDMMLGEINQKQDKYCMILLE